MSLVDCGQCRTQGCPAGKCRNATPPKGESTTPAEPSMEDAQCRCEPSDWAPAADDDGDGSVSALARKATLPPPPQPEEPKALVWPEQRYVGRMGDMTPPGHSVLRVLFDNDNDVIVEVWNQERDEGQSASVEFCNGMNGGGGSPNTRTALIALMVAIEKDNAAAPHKADELAARLATPPAAQAKDTKQ